VKDLRLLIFAALTIAMARALSLIPPIHIAHTRLTFGFPARALCSLVCGPIMGLMVGFAEDILGYALQPQGPFFFGYTVSTMAGMLVYALCFYRARITVARMAAANLLVNIFVNALMGTLWTVMTMGGVYWVLFGVSLSKNLVTVIPKTAIMYVMYQPLLPVLQRAGIIPRQLDDRGRIAWF